MKAGTAKLLSTELKLWKSFSIEMNTILLIFIIIVSLGFILEVTLEMLNLSYRNKPIPDIIADVYPKDRYMLQQRYEAETTWFSLYEKSLGFIITLIVLSFGVFGKLHSWIIEVITNHIFAALLFFAIVSVASLLISLPFSIYSTFVIEEKYGFNKTTPKLFIADTLKSILLSAIVGGGLLAIITWIFYLIPNYFWLIALGILVIFSLLANALYSRVIVPLFNKQEPLQEGDLLEKIKVFAAKVGFPVSKVMVIDGSKRSTKANAYFSGFGKNRRVVLFDTLIDKMSNDEILAVLAHEIGHYRKRHIWINMALGTIQMSVFLYLFGLLSGNIEVLDALGFSAATEPVFHLAIIGFAILFSPAESIISLFTNLLSRRMEYQADGFAGKHGMGKPLVNGLKKLTAENLSNLTPHPFYIIVNYSHPTLYQRILNLNIKNTEMISS